MELLSDYNLSKEEGLLGLCLSGDPSALNYIRLMSPDYFFSTPHQSVCTAIQRVILNPDRDDVNITTVSQELIAMPRMDYTGNSAHRYQELGESDFLIDLTHSALAIPAECDEIYKDLNNYFLKRKSADITLDLSRLLAKTRVEEVPRVITNYISHLQDLLAGSAVKGHHDMSGLVSELIEQMQRIKDGLEESKSVNIYIPEVNNAMGSARAGDAIIILALPGIGKTTFVLADLWEAATPGKDEDGNILFNEDGSLTEPGENVCFWCLDMSRDQFVRRAATLNGIIPSEALRRDEYEESDMEAARSWFEHEVKHMNFTIIDGARDLDTLLGRTYAIHAKTPISRLAIDYFQLLQLNRRNTDSSNRRTSLGDSIAILKDFKNETGILLWVISHSKRDIYQRSIKRHTAGDVTETSDGEKLADAMISLLSPYHFEKVDGEGNPHDPNEIIVQWLKGRDKTDKRDIHLTKDSNGRIMSPAPPPAFDVPDIHPEQALPYGDPRRMPGHSKLKTDEDINFEI